MINKIAALVIPVALALTTQVFAQRQVYEPGNGVKLPIIVKEVKPTYTDSAKARKIQGSVLLNLVVEDDGTVGEVEVERSLDRELDQQAVDAMKQWQFKPGTREGKPVAVRIHCELTFTLPR